MTPENTIFISYEEAAQLIAEGKSLVTLASGTRLSHLRGTDGAGIQIFMQDLTLPGPAQAFLVDVNKDETGYSVRVSRDQGFDDYILSASNPDGFFIGNMVSDGQQTFAITRASDNLAEPDTVKKVIRSASTNPVKWIVASIAALALVMAVAQCFKKTAPLP